jgi:hypothetical protein
VKRLIFIPIACAAALCAQQASTSSTTALDINGNRVTQGPQVMRQKSATSSDVTEKMQSINGRMVPIERVEEHVLKDDASGKVVERVIRSYDPEGNLVTTSKQTIDEQKGADGSTTTRTSTYQGDINGNMQLTERSVTQSQKSDSQVTTDTVIQKPTINGSVETVEKRSTATTKAPDGSYQQESNVYRKDASGAFYAAVRKTTEHTVQGKDTTDNTAEYEVGPDGQLQLHGQTVSKTLTNPDGSKDTVVNIFSPNVPGTVDGGGSSALKLKEQQIIQQTPGPNNSVVQTLSVRRPSVSDPNTLGPEQQLSQTVCKGSCKP